MSANHIRILAVDDEKDIRELLSALLGAEGFEVLTACDGADALAKLDDSIDLVVLDVAMPRENGFVVCRRIRESSTVPILFLTARTQDEDLEQGFAFGGDDYLAKPFSRTELISRIRALLRRCYEYRAPEKDFSGRSLVLGELQLETAEKTAALSGEPLSLTTTEYELLEFMARHPGKVFSAQNLYEFVWKQKYTFEDNNVVIVHISNLRKKLGDDPKSPRYIKNVWGRGYYVG